MIIYKVTPICRSELFAKHFRAERDARKWAKDQELKWYSISRITLDRKATLDVLIAILDDTEWADRVEEIHYEKPVSPLREMLKVK